MDEDWEWIIESLKKYKHLHHYELSQPTNTLEWAGVNEIFVADTSSVNDRFEMLVLSLPSKLSEGSTDTGKLTKDRDFKMSAGGVHNQPVGAMAMVNNRHFVTSSRSAQDDLILWEIRADEDVIVKKQDFPGRRSDVDLGHAPVIAANPEVPLQAARGRNLGNIEVLDLETGKTMWSRNNTTDNMQQPLASIDFISSTRLLLCSGSTGRPHSVDTRAPDDRIREVPPPNHTETYSGAHVPKITKWNCSVNFRSRHNRTSNCIAKGDGKRFAAVVSSDGHVCVYDLRDLSHAVCSAKVTVQPNATRQPCVEWSSVENLLSVSGWDSRVHIYDVSQFDNGPSTHDSFAEPIFTYDGHVGGESRGDALWVTNHLWHEQSPRLVLSGASDGSLHAWEWLPT